ncbi:MAG: hypothetical protein K2K89_12000 [Ruminococcus sp.]|nr:hypothetical protein [Ruminococcus sp.]
MEKNNVRYQLDFILIPLFADNQGVDFVNSILESRGSILCNIFNSFYDEAGNNTFFKDNPKHFTDDQFIITEKDFDDEMKIIHISLPDEHEGSEVYCKAYIFACYMKDNKMDSCSMFTVEKSMVDATFICKMTNGQHMNFGFGTGSVDGDIQRIRNLVDNNN